MYTFRCGQCEQIIWGDERSEDGDICRGCIEGESTRANRDHAIEQELDYISKLSSKTTKQSLK